MKFGVMAGYILPHIYVGRISKNGREFLPGKEEATDMVLAAVAEYTMRNFDGGLAVDFPRLGLALVVNVTAVDFPSIPKVSGNEEVST
jgi:hypothetical protein